MITPHALIPSYQRKSLGSPKVFPIQFFFFFPSFFWAMSETMSGHGDWLQFYQQNLPTTQVTSPIDSTVVTTTVTSANTLNSPLGTGNSSSNTGHLSPEGRVSKPIRRRSRASRRTPTTLLNTDTTNFRAMVQQFTGGPSAPFASGPHPGAPNFGFALGAGRSPTAMMLPPAAAHHGYHLQPHQQQLYPQQGQQYMFSLANNSNTPVDHALLQRLGSSRPTNMGLSDGFVMEGGGVQSSSQVLPPVRPSTSSNENRSNSFLF